MTSPNDMKIVPYSTDRKPEIAALLNICLGQKLTGERDAAYWTWKHERNPFGPSILLLADADGRLVGVRAFLRWRLATTGRVVEVAKPVDTVTHPEYQGRGIFTRLTIAAIETARQQGVTLLCNTPNQNSLPGYLKLGWREAAQLPLYVKPLRPLAAAWRLLHWRLRLGEVPPIEAFFRSSPIAAETAWEDAASLNRLIATAATPALATVRSLEFLRWRYVEHPHIPYFVETIGDAGRLEAALFYRTNFRAGLREIMIDDVLVREDPGKIVPRLIRQLARRVRAEYLVAHAAADTPLLAALRHAGFWRIPKRRIQLVARPLVDDFAPDPFRTDGWSLCLGDIEGL